MTDPTNVGDIQSLGEYRRQRLIETIENAFSNLEYPGDDALVVDNDRGSVGAASVRDKFAGLDWRNVGDDRLRDASSDLAFMTPDAFRFFLPAHMIATLRHEDRFWSLHVELVYDMTIRPESRHRFMSNFSPT